MVKFKVLLLILLILLNGCMPIWVWDYYSPHASDGTVTKSSCQRAVGPPNRLEIIRNDVIISAITIEVKNEVVVIFNLEVPEGKEARLVNTIVNVSIPSTDKIYTGTLKPSIILGLNPRDINAPMIGGTKERKFFSGRVKPILS